MPAIAFSFSPAALAFARHCAPLSFADFHFSLIAATFAPAFLFSFRYFHFHAFISIFSRCRFHFQLLQAEYFRHFFTSPLRQIISLHMIGFHIAADISDEISSDMPFAIRLSHALFSIFG